MCSIVLSAQEQSNPTTKDTTKLNEVIVIGERKLSNYKQEKTLSSIDDYLEKSNLVTMIKRGGYAWEPTLNNMTSERLTVTIDGMQIFGACTDKMDPVTSYVDVSNIEKVSIASGQSGNELGHGIGGTINLQLPQPKFNGSGLKTGVDLGYETNGNYKTAGLDLEYSGHTFYINADAIFRKSDHYKAGNNQDVAYSQFQKYNLALQGGYALSEHHTLNANIIYDKATDVGYPALPMDVSLAEAFIASISHSYKNKSTFIKTLNSKLYYNTITHTMDDSQRPDVPIRMDMPGWSDTFGFFNKATAKFKQHQLLLNLNGFYNRSLAEMTMYPNNSSQPDMFMFTWPDIRTAYLGIMAKDNYTLSKTEILQSSVRFGVHNNIIANNEGLESLRIFYPGLSKSNARSLLSLASTYKLKKEKFNMDFGLGYGERAPSVSEGYGFYLFNSFDNFDYIGNPTLKNEKAFEAHFSTAFNFNHFKIGLESSFFHIKDYIIGEISPDLSTMTIGATGVKMYSALNYAHIFDVYLNVGYHFTKRLMLNTSVGYNYGKGSNNKNLPLIKPFSYFSELTYTLKKFNIALQLEGNANQSHYSSFYGEDETPAYGILNIKFGNVLYPKKGKLIFKYGIENILDTYYSTYADWNNIPRKGRNFYINTSFVFP
ncbi:MAG: TonB-dependent receptor plug domain-containing protein [Aestuariibaculum sp.]